MLEFTINNQIMERKDGFKVVADSKNYLEAKFSFSEEWLPPISAIFKSVGGEHFTVILEENQCKIPWEVIRAPFFEVSVMSGDRVTTNAVSVDVIKSGYSEGKTPKEPTPDVYSQILNSAKPPYIGENGNWYYWDGEKKLFVDTMIKAQGPQGIQGENGKDAYTPVRGMDYWTEEDKTEVKSYVDEQIGDTQDAIDGILAIQNKLIGGDDV